MTIALTFAPAGAFAQQSWTQPRTLSDGQWRRATQDEPAVGRVALAEVSDAQVADHGAEKFQRPKVNLSVANKFARVGSSVTPLKTAFQNDEFGQDAPYGFDSEIEDAARDPRQLKGIADIKPYWDYDATILGDDPCLYLCPRPEGIACKEGEEFTPACPDEVAIGQDYYGERLMPGLTFQWRASNLHHNPAYFNDVTLERYGHTYGDIAQPIVSLGLFSTQLIGLPYQMGLDPVYKKMYTLGYHQPGDPVPHKTYQIPLNARAAATQAATVSAIGVILP
ncbi:hypothetical protein [Stratiformator vulcanicus]|uniref:Uncharacterized protein n=1 Tax=Stratiformator vulcanicus TaxID=2527980 RepID=A0A517QXQ4_9PLAN|nr:hypothetical protein [Stratiformator vulcanicus]QDT36436.1 hypothetical protein Pan189_07920 [Stratiformator vulcanicus]